MPLQIAGELGVDDRYAHVNRDLDHALPVGNCVLALLLGRAGPAVNNDEGRDLYAGLLESLLILLLALLGEQRMLVERVDARMRGLLDVLVAPVCDLVYVIIDGHLLSQNVNVKCDFHVFFLLVSLCRFQGGFPFDGSIIRRFIRSANDTFRRITAKSCCFPAIVHF